MTPMTPYESELGPNLPDGVPLNPCCPQGLGN